MTGQPLFLHKDSRSALDKCRKDAEHAKAHTQADLQSMYLPCKPWYVAGFAQKARAHNPSHKQEGTCAQALKSFEAFTKHETTAQSTRKLLAQNYKHIVHGAEGFLGAPLQKFCLL
jgi:hypothetical protein